MKESFLRKIIPYTPVIFLLGLMFCFSLILNNRIPTIAHFTEVNGVVRDGQGNVVVGAIIEVNYTCSSGGGFDGGSHPRSMHTTGKTVADELGRFHFDAVGYFLAFGECVKKINVMKVGYCGFYNERVVRNAALTKKELYDKKWCSDEHPSFSRPSTKSIEPNDSNSSDIVLVKSYSS